MAILGKLVTMTGLGPIYDEAIIWLRVLTIIGSFAICGRIGASYAHRDRYLWSGADYKALGALAFMCCIVGMHTFIATVSRGPYHAGAFVLHLGFYGTCLMTVRYLHYIESRVSLDKRERETRGVDSGD
jgi:hypothetical protein